MACTLACWSYVILETDGLVTMYPGSTKWHDSATCVKARGQRAISEYSLVWLDPRRDRVDGEPLLGMLLPLRAEDDELLGVFGVDMLLDYIRERLGLGRLTGATGLFSMEAV